MAISVLLVLSFVASILAVPSANAQTLTNGRVRHTFIDLIPSVAGVGQPVLVNFGAIEQLEAVNDGWNVTLSYVGPDGKVVNKDYKTFSTGTRGDRFTFTEAGNYTFWMVMPEVRYTTRTSDTNYTEVRSENVTLEIREDYYKWWYPGHSMPADYWTRPVDSQLREWYAIMGSWVDTGKQASVYAPYNEGPETSHILWNTPLGDTFGGLAGGDYGGEAAFQTGDAYEGKFINSVAIAGVLYYNKYVSGNPTQAIVAVDLHTGEKLWERSYNFGGQRLSRGQMLHFDNYNSRGYFAYLWIVEGTTGRWFALDPATGDSMYNMTGVPTTGVPYYGPNGEILIYQLQAYGGTIYVQQWNSTYVMNKGNLGSTQDAWGSRVRPAGTVNTASGAYSGYDINVTTGIAGAVNTLGSFVTAFPGDRVIYGNFSVNGVTLTGISVDPENKGQVLFNKQTWKAPSEWVDCFPALTPSQNGWAAFSPDDNILILLINGMFIDYAFSADTGKYKWETEPGNYADSWSGATGQSQPEKYFAYGKYYSAGPAGIITCHNASTGALIWEYQNVDKYTESYLRENWWSIICAITDGKIYIGHREHSPLEPKPRGAPFLCLDAETGDLIWEIDGAFRQTMWGGRAVMSDSIIATLDTYDNQIYAIGKGPSELSVSVSNPIATAGVPVMISGTVLDVSPGTKSANAQLRFPNGVPAVGDESQSQWMLHVYKQIPIDHMTDIKGIDITVYAYNAANDEVVEIGVAQSDASGRYAITWTPKSSGSYDIYAYFEGTGAFYGDTAKTEAAVFDAPVVIEPETPPYEWYIVGMGIAIIAVVIVIGLLILKKK